MISITQVAKGILRIGPLETGHSSLATSPYLVVGNLGAAIVEPGEDGQVSGLLEAVERCGVGLDRVEYVWASHIHLHHIQGVPLLLNQLPRARFVVHPRGAPHVIEPTRLIESTIEVWGDKCYGPFPGIPREKVMSVEDGQVLDLGGKQLEVIYAPGHAPHHMGLFDRQTRALFPGDVAMVPGPGRERGHHDIRPPLFDLDKYVQTIHRYQALKPSMLLTFGDNGGATFSVDDTLRWAEEDHLAIERICRTGMKQKMRFQEIVQKVDEYSAAVGSRPAGEALSPAFSSGGLFGMLAYIRKKDPSLELPSDSTSKFRVGS